MPFASAWILASLCFDFPNTCHCARDQQRDGPKTNVEDVHAVSGLKNCSHYSKTTCPQPSCTWISRWFGRSSCTPYCRQFASEPSCPSPECRWAGWWSKCVPQDLGSCEIEHCSKEDCVQVPSSLDHESFLCYPACYRLNADACPSPMCSNNSGPCEPTDLSNVDCLALSHSHGLCTKLAPDRCEWVEEPSAVKGWFDSLFGKKNPEGFCEKRGFVNAFRNFTSHPDDDAFHICRSLNESHCSKIKACEVRAFAGDRKRCTLKWDEDLELQREAIRANTALQRSLQAAKYYGARGVHHSKYVAAGAAYGIAFLVDFATWGVLQGTSWVIENTRILLHKPMWHLANRYHRGDTKARIPILSQVLNWLVLPVIRHPLNWILKGLGKLQQARDYTVSQGHGWFERKFQQVARERAAAWNDVTTSMKWTHVMLPSMNYCKEIFPSDRVALTPESVADAAKRLSASEELCVPYLTNRTQGGRIGRALPGYADALAGVCHELCIDLVDTHHNIANILLEGKNLSTACAKYVVSPVESTMLGCCGRRCGWTGSYCGFWPFMRNESRLSWLAECCTEYQVVDGSERQQLCESVGNATERDLFKKSRRNDVPEFNTTSHWLAKLLGYSFFSSAGESWSGGSAQSQGESFGKSWSGGSAQSQGQSFLQSFHSESCQDFATTMRECDNLDISAMKDCQEAQGWKPLVKRGPGFADMSEPCEDLYQARGEVVEHPWHCSQKLSDPSVWAVEMQVNGSLLDSQTTCFVRYQEDDKDNFHQCYELHEDIRGFSFNDRPTSATLLSAAAFVLLRHDWVLKDK